MCDHNVDARVAAWLRKLGHEAWTVADAGLSGARDDDLTVYTGNQRAVLISHHSEFSRRRRRNVVGRHIFLQCNEWEAADVLERHLDFILPVPDSQPKLSFLWE